MRVSERGRKPIDEVALGERVGPESGECRTVSTENWVDIGLEMGPREEGALGHAVLHLLRPREWAERHGAREGESIELALRELNIEGSARVTSVQRAPALSAGSRCPVTGTIRRSGVSVIVVELERGAAMELTANHRVFSATRNGWVAAGDLLAGEVLQAQEGTARVRSVHASERGLTGVFNLEVFAMHEFFVGEERVWVHNRYTGKERELIGASREQQVANWLNGRVSNEVVVTRFGRTDIDVIAGSGDIVTVGGIAKTPDKVGANLKKLLVVAEERGGTCSSCVQPRHERGHTRCCAPMAWRSWCFRCTFQNTVIYAARPKADPFGWIEAELIAGGNFWHGLVSTSTLFDVSSELCALLFGMANSTGWKPLFAGRGVPKDVSDAFFAHWSGHRSEFFGESWVSLDELEAIDWTQPIDRHAAPTLVAEPQEGERYWNGRAGFPPIDTGDFAHLQNVQPEERVSVGGRTLVHRQLRLEDAMHGTRYPLLLDLMRTIQRHSEGGVRWVIAFSE